MIDSILTILRALIDISLVWIIVYYVLKNIKNNVKMVLLFKGVLVVLIVKFISDTLNLVTIGLLLEYVIMWGPLALIIIFQPEIRSMLEHIGRKQLLGRHKVLTLDELHRISASALPPPLGIYRRYDSPLLAVAGLLCA